MSAPEILPRVDQIQWDDAVACQSRTTIGLADLLTDVERSTRRYVVFSDDQATAVTLWVAHTHALGAAECTPYLWITSAVMESGKTRLLEVLEQLVARPWLTGRVSAAALLRMVDVEQPTLLLDESDAAFCGEREYAEALRGLLNSGYRRSGRATLCVGKGAEINVRQFSTFSPKAIAGIGRLPDTVESRSVRIALKRRLPVERVERFRAREAREVLGPVQGRLGGWARDERVIAALAAARPGIPEPLGDRGADVWEPLLAIADLAGGPWPTRARKAAVALMGTVSDTDISIELLHDIRIVFEETGTAFISSTELVKRLCELDSRPWADWKHGKPITQRTVADRLKPFGIVPIQNTERTARGYYRDRFEDAWSRYPLSNCPNRPNANENGAELAVSEVSGQGEADTFKNAESANNDGPSDTSDTLKARYRDGKRGEGEDASVF